MESEPVQLDNLDEVPTVDEVKAMYQALIDGASPADVGVISQAYNKALESLEEKNEGAV